MREQRLLKLVRRLRNDLNAFEEELGSPTSADVPGIDEDLVEVRTRVAALEMRVSAIEGRADP